MKKYFKQLEKKILSDTTWGSVHDSEWDPTSLVVVRPLNSLLRKAVAISVRNKVANAVCMALRNDVEFLAGRFIYENPF